MLIDMRNAMLMGGAKKPPTAYVQANGIAYIDTGIMFTTNYTARCKFQFVQNRSSNLSPFGFWLYTASNKQAAGRVYWRGGSSDWRYQWPTRDAYVLASGSVIPFGDVHELELSPSSVTLDSTAISVTPRNVEESLYHQSLFGSTSFNHVDGGFKHEQQDSNSIIRIWHASWADENGNLVRDFIPAKQNGEVGFYDRVTETFFGKQGAGTFTMGYDAPAANGGGGIS